MDSSKAINQLDMAARQQHSPGQGQLWQLPIHVGLTCARGLVTLLTEMLDMSHS